MKYYDCCGVYTITKRRNDGRYLVKHRLANRPDIVSKVGEYSTERGAKIALAKYCGGMPKAMAAGKKARRRG